MYIDKRGWLGIYIRVGVGVVSKEMISFPFYSRAKYFRVFL